VYPKVSDVLQKILKLLKTEEWKLGFKLASTKGRLLILAFKKVYRKPIGIL